VLKAYRSWREISRTVSGEKKLVAGKRDCRLKTFSLSKDLRNSRKTFKP